MRFAYDILKNKIPELNERAFDDFDLENICNAERIIIADAVLPRPFVSAYVQFRKRHYILIDKNLKGIRRSFFLWYELSHFFLHAPRNFTNYWQWLGWRKEQFEAESLPLMAILPQGILPSVIRDYDECGAFARRVIEKRIYLLDNWRL